MLFAAAVVPSVLLTTLHVATPVDTGADSPTRVSDHGPTDLWLEAVVRAVENSAAFRGGDRGIIAGYFSPTEAAAVGACLAIVIGLVTGQIGPFGIAKSFQETIQTTGTLFLIVLGAYMFAAFIVQSQIPASLGDWINANQLQPVVVILFLAVVYLVLGCFLESISMILITVPVFLPIFESLGYSPVWFGIFLVIVAEIGLITPPVGLNIFVIRGQQPDISLGSIYRGILPFFVTHLLAVGLWVAIPGLALWMPTLLS